MKPPRVRTWVFGAKVQGPNRSDTEVVGILQLLVIEPEKQAYALSRSQEPMALQQEKKKPPLEQVLTRIALNETTEDSNPELLGQKSKILTVRPQG